MGAETERSHTRTRARARTESQRSSQAAAVPPPPISFKPHQRERSSSVGTTFVSTTVVPAPDSTEILSSLISSLTVLSDAVRDDLDPVQEIEPLGRQSQSSNLPYDAFVTSDIDEDRAPPPQFLLDPSDDEVAEAPVIGYARGGPKPPKKTVKERWAVHRSGRNASVNSLGVQSANHSMRATSSQTGIGVPSIQRPSSSAAGYLPMNGSRQSFEQALRGPLKVLSFSRPLEDTDRMIVASRSVRDDEETRSNRTTYSRLSKRHAQEASRPHKTPEFQPVILPDDIPPMQRSLHETPNSKIYNPLDPANRDDLGDHLIPSRKSSARHSPSKGSEMRSTPSRSSAHNRKLKSPVQEDEEEEDDDPTIRRIHELQRLRDQRQKEREKELARSPKSKKRMSFSEPKAINGLSAASDKALPAQLPAMQPTTDEEPTLSATINGSELSYMPMFSGDKASPLPSPSTPLTPTISASIASPLTPGRTHGPPPSPMKHKRALSGSFKRSASLRRAGLADVKSVGEEIEAFVTASRLAQKIQHPRTGRTIAFSEVGDPDGFTVLVCPGMGLTRYVSAFYDDVARSHKLRLLTLDRPGIGDSDPLPDAVNPPLSWADDVMVVCQYLSIQNFSLLAHSAGAVYALALALKMPNYVQGKIHLLSPYIPQSQLAATKENKTRAGNIPTSQKILSKLPAGLLKVANHRLLSAKSPGTDAKSAKRREKDLSVTYDAMLADLASSYPRSLPTMDVTPGRASALSSHESSATTRVASPPVSASPTPGSLPRPSITGIRSRITSPTPTEQLSPQARLILYNKQLTERIWELTTTNANPGTELIVIFERRRPIGFQYRDVIRSIVIYHGRLDKIVPLQNAQWLDRELIDSELRILDDEDHHLMGNAYVISNVLAEVGRERETLDVLAKESERKKKLLEAEMMVKAKMERDRFIRTGRY